jgi:hypothetical protein
LNSLLEINRFKRLLLKIYLPELILPHVLYYVNLVLTTVLVCAELFLLYNCCLKSFIAASGSGGNK